MVADSLRSWCQMKKPLLTSVSGVSSLSVKRAKADQFLLVLICDPSSRAGLHFSQSQLAVAISYPMQRRLRYNRDLYLVVAGRHYQPV